MEVNVIILCASQLYYYYLLCLFYVHIKYVNMPILFYILFIFSLFVLHKNHAYFMCILVAFSLLVLILSLLFLYAQYYLMSQLYVYLTYIVYICVTEGKILLWLLVILSTDLSYMSIPYHMCILLILYLLV